MIKIKAERNEALHCKKESMDASLKVVLVDLRQELETEAERILKDGSLDVQALRIK